MIQQTSSNRKYDKVLKVSNFDTELGIMVVIADSMGIYLLEFIDGKDFDNRIQKFAVRMQVDIVSGVNDHMQSIKKELYSYFEGKIRQFKTPIHILGTAFQKLIWGKLMDIPYGQTMSYIQQAKAVGRDTSYRAVANANGANRIAIVIPCHRVIKNDGSIGGYGWEIKRKQWLLAHENKCYLDNC